MPPDSSGVYRIINAESGKFYIGSSQNLRKRKNNHFCALRHGKHHCAHLQRAFNAHGEESFKFEVLELTGDLVAREQAYLDEYAGDRLYNSFTQAYAVTGENHPMYGRSHSDGAREKIRAARRAQVISHSVETRAKIGAGNRGKKLSAESVAKMSATKLAQHKVAWNRGLTAETSASLAAGREKLRLKIDDPSIVSRYSDGDSVNSIALSLGCSWNVVMGALRRSGVKTRTIAQQKAIIDGRKKAA